MAVMMTPVAMPVVRMSDSNHHLRTRRWNQRSKEHQGE
jgi:hypothetical protein